MNMGGITFGSTIYLSKTVEKTPKWLIIHELEHVDQFKRDGILGFCAQYFYEYLYGLLIHQSHWKAYEQISYEIQAKEAAKKYMKDVLKNLPNRQKGIKDTH